MRIIEELQETELDLVDPCKSPHRQSQFFHYQNFYLLDHYQKGTTADL
jgi:hypothetical protein